MAKTKKVMPRFMYVEIDRYEGGATTITAADFQRAARTARREDMEIAPVITADGHKTYDTEEAMYVKIKL